MKNKYIFLVLIVFTFGVGLGVFKLNNTTKMYYTANNNPTAEGDQNKQTYSPKLLFSTVKLIIDSNYVEKIDDDLYNEMSIDLAKGMLRELGDQNCRFINKEEMTLIKNATEGKFEGVGIRTSIVKEKVNNIDEEQLYVANVIYNSPAFKAGIKSGDKIILVNDKEILPYNPFGRVEKILQDFQLKPNKSKIKEVQKQIDAEYNRIENNLTILEAEKLISYKNDKDIKIKTSRGNYNLKPKEIKLDTVKENVYNNIHYLNIECFTDKTGEEIEKYINKYNKEKIKYFVLDFRDLFGGTYDDAKSIAKLFIPGVSMGDLETKNSIISLDVPKYDNPWKGNLIILVNKGTAKYGEILASALGRDKSTVIMGENTQGDLNDISIYDLGYGNGFSLTTGKYKLLNKKDKVIPNIVADLGKKGEMIDVVLINKALDMARGNK